MLTTKQKKFVQCYMGNATEAAKKAGYSEKTANEQGARLLANVSIKKAIEQREQKQTNKLIATREQRQEFWTKIMYSEEAEMKDRLKSSELLGKSQADFTDKLEVETNGDLAELLKARREKVSGRGK